MNDMTTYRVLRFGVDVAYGIADGRVSIVGRHLFGARYELNFRLNELRSEKQTFWVRDSRPAVQTIVAAVLALFMAGGIAFLAMQGVDSVSTVLRWIVAIAVVGGLVVIAMLFARRIETTVITYRSGATAFQVPRIGRFSSQQPLFIDSLLEAVRTAAPPTVRDETPRVSMTGQG